MRRLNEAERNQIEYLRQYKASLIDRLIEHMKSMKDIPDQGTWGAAIDECIATVKEYCEVSE